MATHHLDSVHQQPALPSSPFHFDDMIANLDVPNLVDPNDIGFIIGADTDADTDNDTDNDNDNDTDTDDTSSTCSSTDEESDESDSEVTIEQRNAEKIESLCELFNSTFDSLTTDLESQFTKEKVFTQSILTQEVSTLYDTYIHHGNSTRLSAILMRFLGGGDKVSKPADHVLEREEVDKYGVKTGEKTMMMVKTRQVSRLRIAALPQPWNRKPVVKVENTGVAKRKASHSLVGDRRGHGPAEFAGGYLGRDMLPFANGAINPLLPDTPGKMFAYGQGGDVMEIDDPFQSVPAPRVPPPFWNTPSHSRPLYQQHQQQHQPLVQRGPFAFRPQYITPQEYQRIHGLDTSKPLDFTVSPVDSQRIPPKPARYSCTTDAETQRLMVDTTSPQYKFDPLTDLDDNPLTIPSDDHSPPFINTPLNKILRLHLLSANSLLSHLTQTYTLTGPYVPHPPLALFRLAITARLQSQLVEAFTPLPDDPLSFGPTTRALLWDLYEHKCPARLNLVESHLIGRICRVDRDSVEIWWEGRNLEMRGWWALQVWMWAREVEGEQDRERRRKKLGAKGRGLRLGRVEGEDYGVKRLGVVLGVK